MFHSPRHTNTVAMVRAQGSPLRRDKCNKWLKLEGFFSGSMEGFLDVRSRLEWFILRTPESYVFSCFFSEKWVFDLCVLFGCSWLISAERIEGKADFASLFPCSLTSKSDVNQHMCRRTSMPTSKQRFKPQHTMFHYVNTISITTVLHSCKDFPSSRKPSSDSIDFSVACELQCYLCCFLDW